MPEIHKRRPRYSGTHPRRFHEKYKELNPDQYPDAVAKVVASGKTPAGMHRPICVTEILDVLKLQPGSVVVDATLGYGGHASEIIPKIMPGGLLIGLDADPIELPKTEARLLNSGIARDSLMVRNTNFAGLAKILGSLELSGADAILADLGVSSMQLDNPERGFTFKAAGPLDLRMNPTKGQPAAALLASIDEPKLQKILIQNADEPNASLLARSLLAERTHKPITTTDALARCVEAALKPLAPASQQIKATLQRVLQALRIAVNDEFSALETFLRYLPDCLIPGGRVAILTFHSGEDRRVKHAFKSGLEAGLYSEISNPIIRPSPNEVRANPRAASAKLRWAIRSLGHSTR